MLPRGLPCTRSGAVSSRGSMLDLAISDGPSGAWQESGVISYATPASSVPSVARISMVDHRQRRRCPAEDLVEGLVNLAGGTAIQRAMRQMSTHK